MLSFIIFVAPLLILKMIMDLIRKRIKKCNSIKKSNKLRHKAKIIMIIGVSLLLLLSVALFFEMNEINVLYLLRSSPMVFIICLFVLTLAYWIIIKDVASRGNRLIKLIDFNEIFLEISTKSVESVPEKFVLYLRGFRHDSYAKDSYSEVRTYKALFSEQILCEYLNIPMYAVGMNKELWQPKGAMRVYIDDDNWMDEVKNLMGKSLMNVILVNDRSSCIWEIEQSCSQLNKTIFVVDDVDVYKRAKAGITVLELPEVDLKKYWNGFYFYKKDEGFEIIPFNPSHESDYGKLSNLIIKRTGAHRDLNKDVKIIYKVSAILCLMPVIQYVIDIIHGISQNQNCYHITVPLIILTFIALFFVLSYRLLLRIKKLGFYGLIISIVTCVAVEMLLDHFGHCDMSFEIVYWNMINGFLLLISPSYGLACKAFYKEKQN